MAVEKHTKGLAAIEANPSHLRDFWNFKEGERYRDYRYLSRIRKPKPTGPEEEGGTKNPATPEGDNRFPDYVDNVKLRLAQHGFTRPFQLDKDPSRQDKLTTWIEYLNYEYAWHDRLTRRVEHLQAPHDAAWTKLVESGVLRPSETEEYLWTDEAMWEWHREYTAAEKAHELATKAADAILAEVEKAKHGNSRLSAPARKRELARCLPRTLATKEAWRLAKRRDDLLTEFFRGVEDHPIAKKDVYRQDVRLQWVLEQVPLIETELELEASVPDAASSSRPANDASRKTRSGRVTKNASTRVGSCRGTRPRPDVLEEPEDITRSAPQRDERQHEEYETEERASRRLAGQIPEFGMPLTRDGAPLPHASLP